MNKRLPSPDGASSPDEQPLLRALVAEAARKGDTLAGLAQALGVTYERLAQWRRGEGSVANARRSVHEKAAIYLRMPVALVLVLAGQIRAEDFVWPARAPLRDRIASELNRLQRHPHIGAFVPRELAEASPAVKLFVIFICHELDGAGALDRDRYRWLAALHRAALGPDARGRRDEANPPLF